MASQTGLVADLRPAARDQVKYHDRVLRAVCSQAIITATSNSTVLQWDMAGYASFLIKLEGDSNSFVVEGSTDLLGWGPVDSVLIGNNAPTSLTGGVFMENVATGSAGVPVTMLAGNKQTRFMRLRALTTSGTRFAAIVVTTSQTPFVPTRQVKHLASDQAWSSVAPTGGITGTGTVALKAAVNSSHRNLLTKLLLKNSSATGTEVSVVDASSSTTLWRSYIGGNETPPAIDFDPPLRASANSALNLVIGTTGSNLYINALGLTALA